MPQKRPSYRPVLAPCRLAEDFPFACGQHLQRDHPITFLHRHDVLELGYCYEGSGIFVVEDKVLPFRAGCAIAINERELHLAQSTPGTTSRWTFAYFDPKRLLPATGDCVPLAETAPLWGPQFPNVLDPDAHARLCGLIRALCDEGLGGLPHQRAVLRGLITAILGELHRLPGREEEGVRPPEMDAVAPALNYIGRHWDRPVGIGELAAACALSPTHFRRVFRAALGQTPKAYLTRFRVQKAADLLRSEGLGVLDCALRCGFGSLSAFNRSFRAVLGCSPRAWRR